MPWTTFLNGTSNTSNSNAEGNRSLSSATIVMNAIRKISSGSSNSLIKDVLSIPLSSAAAPRNNWPATNFEKIRLKSMPMPIAINTKMYFFSGFASSGGAAGSGMRSAAWRIASGVLSAADSYSAFNAPKRTSSVDAGNGRRAAIMGSDRGGMGERLKPAVLKTVCGATRTGVRIPLPPPC